MDIYNLWYLNSFEYSSYILIAYHITNFNPPSYSGIQKPHFPSTPCRWATAILPVFSQVHTAAWILRFRTKPPEGTGSVRLTDFAGAKRCWEGIRGHTIVVNVLPRPVLQCCFVCCSWKIGLKCVYQDLLLILWAAQYRSANSWLPTTGSFHCYQLKAHDKVGFIPGRQG